MERTRDALPASNEAVHHGVTGAAGVRRVLLLLIPVVLAGYAIGDRGFAYLASVPGTPVFAGEVILLLGGLFVVLATGHLRVAVRASLPLGILLLFIAWGLVRTIPGVSSYGLDAVRDAALWYYALMAVLVATLVVAVPELVQRWVRLYGPFVVVLLLFSPIALALGGSNTPTLPGGVGLFAHKPGNIAVCAATAVAFLWLVPGTAFGRRTRALLTAAALIVILAVGTQNRGGLVAALVAIVLTGLLMGRGGRRLGGLVIGTALVGLTLGWGLGVHLTGSQGRDYSVAQLVENAVSTTGGSTSGNLSATVAFRDQLWSGVINLAGEHGALGTGLGFGPNLAQELGVALGARDPLRSPHNSHVDVLARMGIVGGLLWIAFWGSWLALMLRRSLPRRGALSALDAGVVKMCVVGVTATLVNAYFDPTLESPQVAIWLWTLAGLGLGIVVKANLTKRSSTVAGIHS